jgi:hypothetical protein
MKQAAVGNLMSQRVLECVFGTGQQTCLVEEFPGLELGEAATKVVLGQLGGPSQQIDRNVLADDRGGLEEALVLGRQAVDSGGENRLDRRGNLNLWQRSRQPMGAPLPDEDSGLDEGPHTLLKKEGIPLRPLDQDWREERDAGVVSEQTVEQLPGIRRRKRVETELSVISL